MKVRLTERQRLALAIIRNAGPGGVTPGMLADELWRDSPAARRIYRCGAYGSATGIALNRSAGGYLGRLRKAGLVGVITDGDGFPSHVLTSAGRAALEDAENPTEPLFRCHRCSTAAPWTDGCVRGHDGSDIDEFWCRTCGAETPLDDMEKVTK